MRNVQRKATRNRPAAAMVMALVVLLVVGMVSGLTLRAILRSHRQVREEEQRVQAELLADSALSRAVARLKNDPTWRGETWEISLAEPADVATSGVATIRVENGAQPGRRQLSVTAVFPDDPVDRAVAVREMTYSSSQPGEHK